MDYNNLKEKDIINRRGYLIKDIELVTTLGVQKSRITSKVTLPKKTQFTILDKKYNVLIKTDPCHCCNISFTFRTKLENIKIYGI